MDVNAVTGAFFNGDFRRQGNPSLASPDDEFVTVDGAFRIRDEAAVGNPVLHEGRDFIVTKISDFDASAQMDNSGDFEVTVEAMEPHGRIKMATSGGGAKPTNDGEKSIAALFGPPMANTRKLIL